MDCFSAVSSLVVGVGGGGESAFFHWWEMLGASEQRWNMWDGEVRSQETVTRAKATTHLRLKHFLCRGSDSFVQRTSCHRTFFFFLSRETREATRQSKEDWFLELLFFSVIGSSLLLGSCRCRVFFFFFSLPFLCALIEPELVFNFWHLLNVPTVFVWVCVFLQVKKKKISSRLTHELSVALLYSCLPRLPANYLSLRLLLTHKKA